MKIAEYIWLDVDNKFCSKIKVIKDINEIIEWNYDGSSTGQATTNSSEIILKPVRIFSHPLYDDTLNCFLVVCDTNTRHNAEIIFNMKPDEEPSHQISHR